MKTSHKYTHWWDHVSDWKGCFPIKPFEAKYGRTGIIWIEKATCDRCGVEAEVLRIDSSEDEYGPGSICRACVNNAFDEPK
jgi:hypothetical protein